MKFEWDAGKAESNEHKHGVSFQEAVTIFNDRMAITFDDPPHSDSEPRFLTIGYSSAGRLLVVYHVDRKGQVRIVGARDATKSERNNHESKK
jgi:uncharacterized DUF497 family protein